ncbi:MAG: NAD(P)H-hydrate dehydratase [Anaeromyxobacteraceae bacterium]
MRLASAAEMRAIDRAAIETCGVPGLVLMERAGAAVAAAARALVAPGREVVAVCGAGNNGGDGYVAARLLRAAGVAARAVALAPRAALRGDALAAREAAEAAGVPISDAGPEAIGAAEGDVVVDALLGTGLSRAPEGAYAAAIRRVEALRARGARVVAVDVPSGLSADTGRPLGACVRADVTVTFAFQKRGLVLHPGPAYAGDVRVVDIGIPAEAAARVPVACELLAEDEARALVPARDAEAHKGDAGRVVVVAGSPGKSGAAHLALTGALRGGAGLVTLAARAEVLPFALAGRPEAMSVALPGAGPLGPRDLPALVAAAEGASALVVGPGIPRGDETGALLRALLERAGVPAVLDADALNAVAADPAALLGGLPAPVVLTPHLGEMARLCATSVAEVQADRIALAQDRARAWGCVVVLKGARTVVAAPGAPPAVVPAGNPGMATGGTGDVLAGLTGALLGSGLPAFDAARAAAFAHGLAGDLAAERLGERGLLAGDLADALGAVWARWKR